MKVVTPLCTSLRNEKVIAPSHHFNLLIQKEKYGYKVVNPIHYLNFSIFLYEMEGNYTFSSFQDIFLNEGSIFSQPYSKGTS